jgi:threonine dehydratase
MIPTIEDVRAAAKRIEGIAVKTPLIRNDVLDELTGAKVWVKAECLQRGGAFKMRGATNALRRSRQRCAPKASSRSHPAITPSQWRQLPRYSGSKRQS